MSLESDLGELLGRPGVRVLAFDPNGVRKVPLPADLVIGEATELVADGPLDAIAPQTQSRAVAAYERARRSGHGVAEVELIGDQGGSRLDIFDLSERYDCFVAVASPVLAEADDEAAAVELAPRRALYDLNITGAIVAISPEFTAMLGWTEDEVVGRSSLDLIHADDHEAGIVAWIELLEKAGAATRLRQRYRTRRGDWLWCEVTDRNDLERAERPVVRGELVDVSREMAAQVELQRRETLLDRLNGALPTGVLYLDANGRAAVCNERWSELTGLRGAAGIRALLDRIEEPGELQRALDRVARAGVDVDLEISFVAGGAGPRYGEIHLRPLREGDEDIGLLVTLDDVTSMRSYQNELAEQARRDHLTSVCNRLGVEEALDAKLRSMRSGATGVALLFIDLDRFKAINDTHGHVVGDRVLQLVADHIGGLIRPGDTLGRVGGDEFIVVLGGQTSPTHASALADRIRSTVPQCGDSLPAELHIGLSVGVSFAGDGDDFDSLVKRADADMYRGKQVDRAGAGRDDRTPEPAD